MKKLAIVFICIVTLTASTKAQSKIVQNLSAERFNTMSTKDKNGVLIDLRTTVEIKTKGFIKGSSQLDFLAKDAEQQIDKLDKNKTYYIYCAGGGRSSDCAEYMEKHGFKLVYNLEKGFSDWLQKGYSIERK